MKSFLSNSISETQDIARNFLNSLSQKNTDATIVGLYGNLGSGKTAFTQRIGKELGIEEPITSPTFVIMKIYETKHQYFKRLIHIDAYRLSRGRELQDLKFEELVNNQNNLVVIEWPENVKEILPGEHIKIKCDFVDETSRIFEVQ
ncbi:MAG TPA: tRNA (adenosine(37)-N6)-threonylcarbamoyltransferase complex ATPase subunit type 1 TsaE [Candidatus Paceibacterota bacterium]